MEAIKAVKVRHRSLADEAATCPRFGSRGSVRYDARSYTLMSQERVSLNTLDGRIVCHLVLGARQRALLADREWRLGERI